MKILVNRFPLWLAISSPSSLNIKSLLFALAAGAAIAAAGCGKGKETPAGTNTAPTADQPLADAGPAGHWEAEITGDGGQRIRVSLDLAKNAKSEWTASMGVPSANMTGMVVKDLAVNGKSVKFVAVELMMAPFDLTLDPNGSMKGTISKPGSQPVEFKRTGEAKVELLPASAAVSKELEGDWEGSLKTPGGAARMVFHFRNQADQTVMATIDTDHAVGLPLNNVKQTGQKVEFGMKISGGAFQGSLNKESTELAGQLTHEANSFPLTLRKKSGQPPK
ncbi:MAG: hypothetical protein WCQ21_04375 [Verrucomicrobiota bacterium]|jgi:hypothetical protein